MRQKVVALIQSWLMPRSSGRDQAFRERIIRLVVTLGLVITALSFIISAFSDEWSFFSMPTLHIALLILFVSAGFSINRGNVTVAGFLLVGIVLFAAVSFAVLIRQDGSIERFLTIIPVFMFGILMASLVVDTRLIMYFSTLSILLFAFAQYAIPIQNSKVPPTNPVELIALTMILLLLTGMSLRQLRLEFDARLAELNRSIENAETERKRAEEADKTKSQFLANMSHELRTPLNAIIGYDEAMLAGMAGEFTPQQIKLLGHIQHNSRRLLNLINDILDLSKIESGSVEIYVSPMSPLKTLTNAVEGLRSLAIEKDIFLKLTVTDNFPEIIMGDARKIEQIIVNLLSNAIKFTDQGGVTVHAYDVSESEWGFYVQDTGIGISQEALEYIFEPFRQVDGTPTKKYKGTGLGLSITKQLVEMMGGSIQLVSKLTEGSIFHITLPRVNLESKQYDSNPKLEQHA